MYFAYTSSDKKVTNYAPTSIIRNDFGTPVRSAVKKGPWELKTTVRICSGFAVFAVFIVLVYEYHIHHSPLVIKTSPKTAILPKMVVLPKKWLLLTV